MKFDEWRKQNKALSWIILIAVVYIFIIGPATKKENPIALVPLAAGAEVAGPVLTGAAAWLVTGGFFWPIVIGSALFLGPGIISSWGNLFAPQPTIPSWVWIAGFAILALMLLRKK